MDKLACIAIGGAVGSVLRYLVAGFGQRASGSASFPWGTLLVNVLGCLVIGALGAVFASPHRVREETRLFLLVGLLGGFTTFSTFAWETFTLADDRQLARACGNLALSNGLCLVAVWLGYRLVQSLRGS
jgi:CrcB protein